MTLGTVVSLMRSGIFEILMLAAPVLFSALIVGLIVAIFLLGVLALLGGWMFASLRDYTINLFMLIPQMVR